MSLISKTDQLTVFAQPKPYALLQPRKLEPRTGEYHNLIIAPSDIQLIYDFLQAANERGDTVAIDLETRGTDPQLPESEIVGIGFAGSDFSCYIDRTADRQAVDDLISTFPSLTNIRWIAHNISFDGLWFYHILRSHISWHVCTYALYRHLATEGWLGQQWSLKTAMTELLLWENTNEDGIDGWLRGNGYVNQSGNAQKSEMWRVPADILGSYCILDAEATYLLYTYILGPVYNRFPALVEYHGTHFMKLIEILIQQRLTGILVDRHALGEAYNEIADYLDSGLTNLRTNPEVVEHITAWEDSKKREIWDAQPEQYLRKKERKEPAQFTKSGEVSKNWEKWKQLEAQPPVVSKNWEKWEAKWKLTEAGLNEDCQFNFRSGDHLRWLFYNQLGYPVTKTTETGLPVVDVDTVGKFGETGKLLESYLLHQKEMGFVEAYLELTESRPTIHAGFKTPGTLTGRLSGTSPNLQQLPKSRRFLSSLVARPGHVWIDADFTALEPVVCTELTGDPALMQVYGPDAEPGADIYLHTGAGIPALAQRIRAEGYIPGKLTKEAVAHVKRVCKQERAICKVVYLSCLVEGTPVRVRNRGILPIEQVRNGDEVWDGTEWVITTGAIDKGTKRVYSMEQVWMTNDHKVLGEDDVWRTQEEWAVAKGNKAPQPKRPNKPSASWAEVWQVVRSIFRSLAGRRV